MTSHQFGNWLFLTNYFDYLLTTKYDWLFCNSNYFSVGFEKKNILVLLTWNLLKETVTMINSDNYVFICKKKNSSVYMLLIFKYSKSCITIQPCYTISNSCVYNVCYKLP